MKRISLYKHHDKGMFDFLSDLINLIYYETNCNRTLIELSLSFYLSTESYVELSSPNPFSRKRKGANKTHIIFLFPSLAGEGLGVRAIETST